MTSSSGGFPFFDINSLLGGLSGADPWKTAADMATAIASDGGSEPNLDPVNRIKIEELARVAELHVSQSSGLTLPPGTKVEAVTRGQWSRQSVDVYRPILERFGEALSQGMKPEASEIEAFDPSGDMAGMTAQMMGQIFASLGPMLVATSAGTMLGHLGLRALGQYDLPVPRNGDSVLIVPSSIDVAAMRWEVPVDELQLWILLQELTAHAVLSVPHVQSRLEALFLDFASAFRADSDAMNEKFGQITDLNQLQELSATMSDPNQVLSMLRTPAHDLLMPQIDALVAAILGSVDHTVDKIAAGLMSSHEVIRQRFRQRWAEADPADRFMERLLGLKIDEATVERGDRFVAGVLERAGDEGLRRLWSDELDLPTAAEVDAPGLWLARIGYEGDNDLERSDTFEVPDDLSGLGDLD